MIRVKSGENILYATLSERESVASPVYSLKLTSKENKSNPKTVTPTDLSVAGERVNKLRIEVVTDSNLEDLPNGLVFLNGGDYLYEIRNNEDKLLEKGVLMYDTTLQSEDYTDNNVTEKVYNG